MGLFDFFRQRIAHSRTAPADAVVQFDEEDVTCVRRDGHTETVRWSDLRAVMIQTSAAGPWADDLFWVLASRDGGCVVPSEAAARARCGSNLRQMGLAVHQYSSTWDRLPKGCDYPSQQGSQNLERHIAISWQTAILPFVEQEPLARLADEAYRQDPRGHAQLHMEVLRRTVPVYTCPTEPRQLGGQGEIRWGLTSYLGVAGSHHRWNDGLFHSNYRVRFEGVLDGTSNTLMIGERPAGPGGKFGGWYAEWGYTICDLSQILSTGGELNFVEARGCRFVEVMYRPGKLESPCHMNHFWSLHSAGAQFAFADGSVRLVSYSQAGIMEALATRAGGEIVETP